jgi:hypothetical protein
MEKESKMSALTRDWTDLQAFYLDLAAKADQPGFNTALNGLAVLCGQISKSHLRETLFAHQSMHDLFISQTDTEYPPHPSVQWMVIRPLPDGMLEFTLEHAKAKEGDWLRRVPSDAVVTNLNKFLLQLGWTYHPIPE